MAEINMNVISATDSKIRLGSLSHIISQKNSRTDMFGNQISKKTKKHKISFPDQVNSGNNSKNLVDVTCVKSYRQFNKLNDTKGNLTFIIIDDKWNCRIF
jgi:hypothetical protein